MSKDPNYKTVVADSQPETKTQRKSVDVADKQFAISLYEKGLISKKAVLTELGFDVDAELKQMKEEAENQAHTFAARPLPRQQNPSDIIATRIEQARRNVEVLGKLMVSDLATQDIVSVFAKNLKILDEVDQIK